jgi:UrcA family protein
MTRTQTTASILAFAAAVAIASPVLAAPLTLWGDDEKVAATVAYQDAELRTPEGAAKVAGRIRTAARQVCGGGDPVVASGARFQRCQHKVIDHALASLDAPLVADALGRAPATSLAKR